MADASEAELTYDEWYQNGYGRVLAAVVVFCAGDRPLAEDAVSEAFTKAFMRWSDVSTMESSYSWVTKVAINWARRRYSRNRRRGTAEQMFAIRDAFESPESQVDFWRILESLSQRQRRAIALKYVFDRTQSEIASTMGIAEGTAGATLHQARRNLAHALEIGGTKNENS